MEPDKYQQAWQAHTAQTRFTVKADLLLQAVQRKQQEFRATIFLRDFREIATGIVMLPLWFVLGIWLKLPWTWYLTVPAYFWLIGFILVDRMRHKPKPSEPGEPLVKSATESLAQLEHQIWLLRNVFWWYLLPFTLSILAFFFHVGWSTWRPSEGWPAALASASFVLFLCFILFAVYGFVYWLNQHAVRSQLEPRRRELLALLAGLGDETTGEVSGEYPILLCPKPAECSRRRWFAPRGCLGALLSFLVLLSIGIGGIVLARRLAQYLEHAYPDYPKKSPFAAVRWQQSQPEVKVGDEWFKLVSLDGLPAGEIVVFSQVMYGSKWQKRFEEDLVELLTRMDHPPRDKVTLVVQSLTSSQQQTLADVPMTEANRRAIYKAARAREHDE